MAQNRQQPGLYPTNIKAMATKAKAEAKPEEPKAPGKKKWSIRQFNTRDPDLGTGNPFNRDKSKFIPAAQGLCDFLNENGILPGEVLLLQSEEANEPIYGQLRYDSKIVTAIYSNVE